MATKELEERGHTSLGVRRWWVLAVMSVSVLIIFIDNSVVNTALPSIAIDLGASTSTLQWVVDSYVLALAGLLLLAGSVGDRFGRRRWMTFGLVVFGAGAVTGALADGSTQLIAARAIQGLGAAFVLPATLSIITDVFPREERAKAIGIWTGVGALGLGIGPALGGYLVTHFGWASVFWMHVPIVVAALVGLVIVPESKDPRRLGLDVPGAILGTAGLTALVYGIIQGNEAGWTSVEIVGSFALAISFLGSFVIVESRMEHPMLPMRFFRQKDFTGAVLVIGMILFAMLSAFFFLTQFLQLVQGRSALQAGMLIIPVAGAMMVGAPISGATVGRVGPRLLNIVAVASMAGGMLLLSTITVGSSVWAVIVPLAMFGLGGGLALAPLTDTVMAAVPVNDAGVGSAVNDVSRELGGALGVAVIGAIVNGSYAERVGDALAGSASADVIEVAKEGIGGAVLAGRSLGPAGDGVVSAANTAFVDAITSGFRISAAILVATLIVVVTMLPKKMRSHQAGLEAETGVDAIVLHTDRPTPTPGPVPERIRS